MYTLVLRVGVSRRGWSHREWTRQGWRGSGKKGGGTAGASRYMNFLDMGSVGVEDSAKRMNPKAAPTTMTRVHIVKTLSDNIMTCRNVDVCLLVPATVPMSRFVVLAVVVMGIM